VLLGGLNGRKLERLPVVAEEPPLILAPGLPLPRVIAPALGFSIEPVTDVPLAADSPAERPPAGSAPTWLCCIVCRRLAVCAWNDCG
jgi:hypothetical protein